jgi:hypothetical protein
MTSSTPADEPDLPLEILERIDAVCARFEADWRAGQVPRLADFLVGLDGAERRLLFRELLHIDAELRKARGLALPWDCYSREFAEYRDLLEALAPPAQQPETPPRRKSSKTDPSSFDG